MNVKASLQSKLNFLFYVCWTVANKKKIPFIDSVLHCLPSPEFFVWTKSKFHSNCNFSSDSSNICVEYEVKDTRLKCNLSASYTEYYAETFFVYWRFFLRFANDILHKQNFFFILVQNSMIYFYNILLNYIFGNIYAKNYLSVSIPPTLCHQ